MAKVLVTMPDDFLNKVDGLADLESCSRSELIREALKSYMRRVSKQQLKDASRNAEILEEILN
ncbi:ribbon-helix-helix protein, CopG family [bacterium]|nr:ribbon-helix-helix protein, CopG family [bacterium]